MVGRRLTADEAALWGQVAGTVRAYRPRKQVDLLPTSPKLVKTTPRQAVRAVSVLLKTEPKPHPTIATLDGGWDRRLAGGKVTPDFTVDLHGETLDTAHSRLMRSLAIAIAQHARVILLITGRPARENPRMPPTSRGVIRASVTDWIAASPHARHIAAIRPAHQRHGGAGALYLILRRSR